jgi:ABC-type glycerol-3-phosphate transport system permease component
MAGATIAVLPVILVYLGAQRQFVRGITLTGINR